LQASSSTCSWIAAHIHRCSGPFRFPETPPGAYELTFPQWVTGFAEALLAARRRKSGVRDNSQPDTLRQTDSIEVTQALSSLSARTALGIDTSGAEAKNLPVCSPTTLCAQSKAFQESPPTMISRAGFRSAAPVIPHRSLPGRHPAHAPFHMVANESATGSVAAFNGDTLREALPARRSLSRPLRDRNAGVLIWRLGDGTSMAPSTASLQRFQLRFLAEAPSAGTPCSGSSPPEELLAVHSAANISDPSFAFGIRGRTGQADI